MASPRRIYRIYLRLAQSARELADFLAAKGEKVPGTLQLLIAQDRGKLLSRWGEEMDELCGVLDGSHHDPYIMESTQTFYWASLFAATGAVPWEELKFEDNRRLAATCGIETVDELRAGVKRLVEGGPAKAKAHKLFLLWNVADRIYRTQKPADKQWSLEELMEADLQEMKKRPYLEPILREISE